MEITMLLSKLGVRSTNKGFHYIRYALELCLEDENYLLVVFKELYPKIAEEFDATKLSVEHCIRTAVNNCWSNGNRKLLFKIAGYELPQKPTNGEFIDILYRYLEYINTKED